MSKHIAISLFEASKTLKQTLARNLQDFLKACQYEIVEERVSKGLKYISIKFAQVDLQKCITWLKNSRKRIHEWMELALV